jgi:hypothetical protein
MSHRRNDVEDLLWFCAALGTFAGLWWLALR